MYYRPCDQRAGHLNLLIFPDTLDQESHEYTIIVALERVLFVTLAAGQVSSGPAPLPPRPTHTSG